MQYIRYMADDFCPLPGFPAVLSADNRLAYLVRYPLYTAGVWFAPWFCILFLGCLWLGVFVILRVIFGKPLFSAIGALFFVGVLLTSADNVIQSVYWQSGMLVYTLPLILNLFTIWLILQRRLQPMASLILCFIVVFLASMVSDAFAVAQVILFVGLFVVCLLTRRQERILSQRLLVCAIGAVLAIAIILISSGTQTRITNASVGPLIQADPSTISRFLHGAVRGLKDPLIFTLRDAPVGWAAMFLVPFMAGQSGFFDSALARLIVRWKSANPERRYAVIGIVAIVAIPAFALMICMAMWAGGYVAQGKLPTRTWILGQYFVLMSTAIVGYSVGVWTAIEFPARLGLVRRLSVMLIAIALVGTAINETIRASSVSGALYTYSQLADQRDAQLRAGILTVSELPSFGLNDLGVPWVDQCLRNYYHLPANPTKVQ